MFRGWDFLLGEIWTLLLLAALLGLVAGWLFWGRRLVSLAGEVEEAQYKYKEKKMRLSSIEDELRFAKAKHREELDSYIGGINERDERIETLKSKGVTEPGLSDAKVGRRAAPARRPALSGTSSAQFDTAAAELTGGPAVSVISGLSSTGEHRKPATMSGPRDGVPDDLKKIRGVGPKLEVMLNDLGFYHFDQVALWGEDEIGWVDANLEGFSGRVKRDHWVGQARALVAKRQVV